ncbi:2'-5' RNA ligase family protein [Paenarthrobacter sp. PH39-S1]|uniref:2'-5' RNA ligase family protein n=1 Tax=Paenarthrobacter sp. PH39-S1 TaxID=3046204 RepID=UPI0024B96EA0|nr:2'-5' RNA ligase family protein [Paenarthrobacter sp. PH39-S1]MDJ0354710.1 2'-5' RNA ligase family protein [Paenarthrobacter sp. PH39-S1]
MAKSADQRASTRAAGSGELLNAHADGRLKAGADPDPRCVGIIVALPEPLATEITNFRRSFGDRLGAVIPAHITLVTTTPAEDWEETVGHVREVAREQHPFTVAVSGTASFRPVSPVVYLQIQEGFEECVRLHEKLQSGPLARDLAFNFHPHITVAHDIGAAGLDEAAGTLEDFAATFPVTGMGLYEHDSSGVWLLKEELNFGGTSEKQSTRRCEAAADRAGKTQA